MNRLRETPLEDDGARIGGIYDDIADGYDQAGTPAFANTAERILEHLASCPAERLLDACTGTGVLALAAARGRPQCEVVGIDVSTGMLEQARAKANDARLSNVRFEHMNLSNLDFDNDRFDISTCSFGLYFLPNMRDGLRQMCLKTRAGGNVVFTTHDANAYAALTALIKEDYMAFRSGREYLPPWQPATSNWKVLADDDSIRALCHTAGLGNVTIRHEPMGFELESPGQWWDIVWNGTYRNILKHLSSQELQRFKEGHLARVRSLCERQGSWVDTDVVIVVGEPQ